MDDGHVCFDPIDIIVSLKEAITINSKGDLSLRNKFEKVIYILLLEIRKYLYLNITGNIHNFTRVAPTSTF